MRQYLLVAAIFLVGPYRQLLMRVGGLLTHPTDIADIPDLVFGGAVLVTGLLLLLGFGTVYVMRRAGRRLTSA